MSTSRRAFLIHRSLAGALFLLWGAATLVVWSGCDDPVDLCEPQLPTGRVQGRVLSGGLTVEAHVTAYQVDDDYRTRAEFKAESDESGFYALDLPYGQYTFRLTIEDGHYNYAEAGLFEGWDSPDTVLVGAGIPTPAIDFILGGVTLEFDLPSYLHGQYGEVVLRPLNYDEWSGPDLVFWGGAEIVTGRFEVEIGGVLPGEYQIAVALGCPNQWCGGTNSGEQFWMPGTHDQAESPWYTVAPDSVLEVTGAFTGEPARIEGRVTGAWLDMGVGEEPKLSIVTEDSLQVLRSLRVNDDGGFSCDFLVPGNVKLMVSQFGIDYWIGGPGFEEATVFSLEPGQTIAEIEHDQCGIHLVVDETGLPFSNGEILIYNKADLSLVTSLSSWGISDRHIAVPNLWPGEFLVHLDSHAWTRGDENWRPQWLDRAATADLAQPVVLVTPGQVARRDLILEPGGIISGRVIISEGTTPYFEVLVYQVGQEDHWGSKSVWDLSYEMTGLPDGDYVVGITSGFIGGDFEGTLWHPGTYDRQEAGVIEIRDASVIENVDITIPEQPWPASNKAP